MVTFLSLLFLYLKLYPKRKEFVNYFLNISVITRPNAQNKKIMLAKHHKVCYDIKNIKNGEKP